MEAMKIIPELAPREIVGKTSTYLPPACYTMSKAEKTKFCQCLSEVKVPYKKVGVNARLEVVCISNRVKTVGITQSRHEGRLHTEGTLGRQDFLSNIDDLREAHFTVLQHMTCIAPYIYEHKSLLKQQKYIEEGPDLGFGPIRVVKYQGYVINRYTFYTKEQDDKSTLQNSGVTLIASTTELSTVNREERSKNAKKAYYGVIQEIWELHYNSTVIPLFKCKWVDNEKGVDVDEDGFTTVNLSTNGYKSEPFMKMVSVQIAVGWNTWTMAKIVECRRVLNWSYAFSYLLPDEEDTKTNLFNYLQGVQGIGVGTVPLYEIRILNGPDDEEVTTVVFSPDHMAYQDKYCADCVLTFTSSCIQIEGSFLDDDDEEPFRLEWGIEDILCIKSHDAVDGDTESSFPTYFPCFDQSFEEVVYPNGEIDVVSIGKRDVDMLLPDTFVNDTIIDFYIKYVSLLHSQL
ncbi:hypothetical protein Tco_0378111 [Tanacetum coccineum]